MRPHLLIAAALLTLAMPAAHAQISLTSAADLALRNNIKVKLAEDDVRKAAAGLAEARGAYIPNLNGTTAAPGYAAGFPLGTPTLYSITSTSTVYSASQSDYVRSSRYALDAANLLLKDVREQALQDVATTYLALDHNQRKLAALRQELTLAQRLEAIVKERLDAGQDTTMESTIAHRTRVRIQLQELSVADEIEINQDHLARLIGLNGTRVESVPDGVSQAALRNAAQRAIAETSTYDTPAVLSAFANAQSRYEQALGDQKYALHPIITFSAAYSKFDTYNNSYVRYYPSVQGYTDAVSGKFISLTSQAGGFAFNISVPLYDRAHKAHADGLMADAAHALDEAQQSRSLQNEGRLKLSHGLRELALRTELAGLDRDYGQEQLDVILIQMQAPPTGTGPAITPKDEQNARINERALYIDLLDQQHLLDQTELDLLRQTGGLEAWLKSAVTQP